MDIDAQKHWCSRLEWHRNDFTAESIPDAARHLSVGKPCIITTDDKTMPVDIQLRMLQAVVDRTWSIKSISSGHELFLSQLIEVLWYMNLYDVSLAVRIY